jgi:Domain of unknown function (DUF4173)
MNKLPDEHSTRSSPPQVAAAIALSGLAGALLLVENPPGLNWLLVAGAIGGAVISAWRRDVPASALIFGLLSLGLVSTALFTSTEWQLAANLLAALSLTSLAARPGRSWGQLFLGLTAAGWRSHRALTWLLRAWPSRQWRGSARVLPLVRGLALGFALLVVFGVLFVSADQAFAQLADRVFTTPDLALELMTARFVVAVIIIAYAASLASFAPSLNAGRAGPSAWVAGIGAAWAERGRVRLGRIEWVTALLMLNSLFAIFVFVQIAVLFGGREHVLETAGLTFAEYARSGFFQLVVVAALTLLVLALFGNLVNRTNPRDDLIFKLLAGALVVLTLVVLASALKRLTLYEAVYGLTRLRVAVHASIFWLVGIFLIVGVAALRAKSRWLPQAVVIFSALALLSFAVIRPDALIAAHNVERFDETGKIDVFLLRGLSPDAVPALIELPEPERSCALVDLRHELAEPESFWSTNFARSTARDILDGIPESAAALENCPPS